MPASDTAVALDPFGYMAGYASAFRPLGGPDLSPDPRYAFHTNYFPFRAGRVRFTIRISDLRTAAGELFLQVNGFAPESGRDPVLVTSSRMDLTGHADVAEHVLHVRCVKGVTYAVYGYIPDADQVSASAVEIFAEEEENGDGSSAQFDDPSSFGTDRLDRPRELVAGSCPSFAKPVSQCLTKAQLSEPDHARWRALLPATLGDTEGWTAAQMLQMLECYGLLGQGARALGLCDGARLLPPILARHGCETECYTLVDGRFVPAEGDAAQGESWTANEDPPATLRGFDVLWSLHAIDALDDYAQASRFVERALRTLRPGGYGLFAINMVDRPHAPGGAGAGIVTRREVERLALTMISRSHDVAQLNFAGDEPDGPRTTGAVTPFILIVRRSQSTA